MGAGTRPQKLFSDNDRHLPGGVDLFQACALIVLTPFGLRRLLPGCAHRANALHPPPPHPIRMTPGCIFYTADRFIADTVTRPYQLLPLHYFYFSASIYPHPSYMHRIYIYMTCTQILSLTLVYISPLRNKNRSDK